MFHFGLIVLKLVSDGRVSVGNLADILLLFLLLLLLGCCWLYIYKPSAGASHSKRVTSMLLVVTTHALWSIIDWAFHLYTGPPCLSTAAESGACSLVKLKKKIYGKDKKDQQLLNCHEILVWINSLTIHAWQLTSLNVSFTK